MNKYTAKKLSDNVIEVRFKYKKGFEQFVLLSSDHHWDNPKCKRKLLRKHHEQAIERGALIISQGDTFCAMQGKGDRRGSKSDIRPEHNNSKYLDSLVNTAADWYGAFADNYLMFSDGNHETSVHRYHETDLTQRLVDRINHTQNTNIFKGNYTGWVIWTFEHESGGKVRRVKQKFNHGYGGGGPVTKGVIQSNRRATYLPDADIITTGHIHERWDIELSRERVDTVGNVYIDSQWHIQLPTYKEEYLSGKGWHIERGAPPKPLGACWLWFYLEGNKIKFRTFWAD